MDKRGQLMSFFLVMLTLIMIGVVLTTYVHYQADLKGAIISPSKVLHLRDEKELFELREEQLIQRSAKEALSQAGETIDSESFNTSFKQKLIEGYDDEMEDFILKDLMMNGVSLEVSSFSNFLDKQLYKEVYFDETEQVFVVKRSSVGKHIKFEAEKIQIVSFPMDLSWEFDRTYKLNAQGEIVEVLGTGSHRLKET